MDILPKALNKINYFVHYGMKAKTHESRKG